MISTDVILTIVVTFGDSYSYIILLLYVDDMLVLVAGWVRSLI